jgi:hypothetical protein
MSGEQEEGLSPEIIQEATTMGWLPLDKFKGDQSHWVDADEYVEKGRQVMPILLANNKRLQADLLTRDQKIGTLESQLVANQTAISKLEEHWTAANKRAVAEAKQGLIASLREARENDDVEAEQQILGQLDDIRIAEKEKPVEKPVPKKEDEAYTSNLSPAFVEWKKDNEWFDTDKKKTKQFLRVAEDLRDDGVTTQGAAFFKEVEDKFEELYGEGEDREPEPRRPQSKVESGNNRSNARGVKNFANLPQDAKKACHDDAEALVGPGKTYKTVKDWEDAYAKIYYSAD